MDFFLQLLVIGISLGAIYAMIALGFVLIYKSSGVLNFAQAEFVLLGAFFCWGCITLWHLPIWLALILTFAVAIIAGFAIERLVLRPMIGQPILAIIMMTIALSLTLRGLFLVSWGGTPKVYNPPVIAKQTIHWGNVVISQEYMWGFAIATVMLILFILFFRYTKTGLAMRATAEDHQVAQSKGIDVRRIFGLSWAIAAVVGGVAGIILANMVGVNFELSSLGFKAIPVVLVGGLESIPGAIIAGLIIGVSESIAGGYIDPLVGGGIKDVFAYIIALLVLFVRPYGLFGLVRIERI